MIMCGLEQRCGMWMVMTYCERTGYGAVYGVLLRVERCKNRGDVFSPFRVKIGGAWEGEEEAFRGGGKG